MSIKTTFAILSLGFITSCSVNKISNDRLNINKKHSSNILTKTEQDLENIMYPSNKKTDSRRNIPKYIHKTSIPDAPTFIDEKLITISLQGDIPVIDVLNEIAKISKIDMQIDSTIRGSISINIKEKPIKSIFDIITSSTKTRYHEENGIIIFENDTPYVVNYDVDFLDITRSSNSEISTSTSVVAKDSGGNSSSGISSSTNDSFWEDVQDNIRQIITSIEDKYIAQSIDSAKYNTDTESSLLNSGEIKANKRAGIITVTASKKSHKAIQSYLDNVSQKYNVQALFDVKVVTVKLNQTKQIGSNFSAEGPVSGGVSLFDSTTNGTGGYLTSTFGSFASAMQFLETLGTTSLLNNMRLITSNNLPAVSIFAKNQTYFKIDTDIVPQQIVSTGTIAERKTIKATAETIPIGMILSITPSINIKTREILVNVRPTLSTADESVADPTIALLDISSTAENNIPVTSVQEMDSIMKIKDGDVMMIGGFTERKKVKTRTSIPYLNKIPLIGNFFFSYNKTESSVLETMILIKATIIDSKNQSDTIDPYDKILYENFIEDGRSFNL